MLSEHYPLFILTKHDRGCVGGYYPWTRPIRGLVLSYEQKHRVHTPYFTTLCNISMHNPLYSLHKIIIGRPLLYNNEIPNIILYNNAKSCIPTW